MRREIAAVGLGPGVEQGLVAWAIRSFSCQIPPGG